jgi:tetratricopeptide (TPR) repeat protein
VNPPLDERTWIVVPFDNLAKAQDVDWLRTASVNLLYLDMSRWRDIRVIDDERVADLIRETPGAADAAALSLNAGLAVAKRAGAGRLVMGDLLKLGNRTAVTAKVFNVRTGQRLKSVREETAVQDSVMPLFGKLAQKILNVAPPEGANVGALGTSRVDAYQEYIAGVEALNHYNLQEGRRRLSEALRLDSTFALAHYKMATLLGWENPSDPARRVHAEAAARLQSGLPARERALIQGTLWQTLGQYARACEMYDPLLKADSADVEAWYGVGECLFHDNSLEAVNGDTTKMRFRGDWNGSIRAFERVLQHDPTYHLAYQHIVDALVSERHYVGCYRADANASPRCVYTAFNISSGDSLLNVPVPFADTMRVRLQAEAYQSSRSRRNNLQRAYSTATAWVRAAPSEGQPRSVLARVLLFQGRIAEADAESSRLAGANVSVGEDLRRILERMEIAYKLGKGAEVIRIYDSVRTTNIPIPGLQFRFGNAIAGYGAAIGRVAEFDSLLQDNAGRQGAPANFIRYAQLGVRGAVTGQFHDSLVVLEKVLFDAQAASRGAGPVTRQFGPTMAGSLRNARATWPALDTTVRDPKLRPLIALMRKDTAALRASARALDSILSVAAATAGADSGFAVIAADAYLILGDTASALRSLRLGLDSVAPTTPYFPQNSGQGPPVYFAPRAMLLRADLAAATGQQEEARRWYKRFIDLWATAQPEFQPLVERARQAYKAVGGTD